VATLDALVDEALAQRTNELQAIVARLVDERLGQLVRQAVDAELEHRSNGHTAERPSAHETATRMCVICNQRPAARHRRVCESCRHKRRAQRDNAAEGEAPQAAAAQADPNKIRS
jgi:hypothetical protein